MTSSFALEVAYLHDFLLPCRQALYECFNNPANDPAALDYYRQTYNALESWQYSGLEMEFSQCFSDLYKYE